MQPSLALSIIVPCHPRDEGLLQEFLVSVDRQAFPKDQLEVLVMRKGNSEEAKARGVLKARGRILAFFCADNQLLGNTFLLELTRAAENPRVVGAYPARYAWMSQDPSLNRYFSLLGANDPLCWWLGKADRTSWLCHSNRQGTQRIVTFSNAIPSIGDNGFFIKAEAAKRVVRDPARFGSCMCMCEDLRRLGYATYAVTDHVIWHKTATGYWAFLRKRCRYVQRLYHHKRGIRRWHMVATGRDWWGVFTFTLASLLVVPHLLVSYHGYRRVRDQAWLWHPFVCGGLALGYAWGYLWVLLERFALGLRHEWPKHQS